MSLKEQGLIPCGFLVLFPQKVQCSHDFMVAPDFLVEVSLVSSNLPFNKALYVEGT